MCIAVATEEKTRVVLRRKYSLSTNTAVPLYIIYRHTLSTVGLRWRLDLDLGRFLLY